MRVEQLLHNHLQKSVVMHSKRLDSLMCAVTAGMKDRCVTVTGLGRRLRMSIKVKNKIKKIDRLVGNSHLHQEIPSIYQCMTGLILGNIRRPIIIVDWSPLGQGTEHQLLRATLPSGGRALTLYESAYPESLLTSRKVHQEFLAKLCQILPAGCTPIIVTDAGFRNTWFEDVSSLGWDWVGRVRNRTHYLAANAEQWVPIKSLYHHATSRPQYIGHGNLSRRTSVSCGLYLYKKQPKGRVLKTLKGAKCRQATSLKIAQREREPWLIATSLHHNTTLSRKIIKIYAKRAQIENGFRDTKNQRLGFSLNDSKTSHTARLNVLLIIIAIATFGLWLLGGLLKQKQLHFQFQANTIKNRNVLSNVFLGWQIINNSSPQFKRADWLSVIDSISIDFNYETIL